MPEATKAKEPVPFFTDERSISDKINTKKENWTPHKDSNQPQTLFGLCVETGEYHDTKYADEPRPTMRLLTDQKVEWSIIGFHGWLRSAIQQQRPLVGDFVAVAYQGVKPAKRQGESDAYMYALAIERNPNRPVPEERGAVPG